MQIAARQPLVAEPCAPGPLPDTAVVIEVLLSVIDSRKFYPAEIAALMRAQGKAITPEQIQAVWVHYELDKKTSFHGDCGSEARVGTSARRLAPTDFRYYGDPC